METSAVPASCSFVTATVDREYSILVELIFVTRTVFEAQSVSVLGQVLEVSRVAIVGGVSTARATIISTVERFTIAADIR